MIPFFRRSSHALLALVLGSNALAAAEDPLERSFDAPPAAARPWVWWHWMNGNITREGITADLEAMARVGLGGGIIFNVDGSAPPGPVQVMSPAWRELVAHATREAHRLGLQLGLHNAPGWSSSGGTWNRPERGMQEVVTRELKLQGPSRFSGALPTPETALRTGYRDVAVVAFPTPAGEETAMRDQDPTFMVRGATQAAAGGAELTLPLPTPENPSQVDITFERPFRAQTLSFRLGYGVRSGSGRIEASDDGTTYRPVDTFSLTPSGRVQLHSFPPVTARCFRISFTQLQPKPRQLRLSHLELSPRRTVDNLAAKAFSSRAGSRDLDADYSVADVINPEQMITVTDKLDASGTLRWEVPPGNWTVLRIGHAPTGQVANQPPTVGANPNLEIDPLEHALIHRPASIEGAWLECDKLSTGAIEAHWNGMMGPVLADAGSLAGNTLSTVVVDSYEIGSQNWTAGFPEEFQQRRGYSLHPYLPTLAGRVVASPAITERFLWDFRRTLADLFAERYTGHLARMAERQGLRLEVEPYGNGPFDDLQYAGGAHVPLGEFWIEKGIDSVSKLAASVGHTYGQNIIGAEAFTGGSGGGNRWEIDPFGMKALGDAAFCAGINRFEIHSYVHQPWLDRAPGITLSAVGTHYNRNITWWEQSRAWIAYLTRCQALLQQGLTVSDICLFPGEALPSSMYGGHLRLPSLPIGYEFDACSAEVIVRRMEARDGRIVLPDGKSYRTLVLQGTDSMSLPVLKKLKLLADAGVPMMGPRPTRTPGLTDFPGSEAELRALTEALWGSGRIQPTRPLPEWIERLELSPDFSYIPSDARIRFHHRVIGDADVYFVSNQDAVAREILASFRVQGREPELWSADSARRERAVRFREAGGRTEVPLRLDPSGSVFVVFRRAAQTDPVVEVIPVTVDTPSSSFRFQRTASGTLNVQASQNGTVTLRFASGRQAKAVATTVPPPVAVDGPWELQFPRDRGAPDLLTLSKLQSWSEHPDAGVAHFSGTATYRTTLDIDAGLLRPRRRLELDLGTVKNLAEVSVNGQQFGILWKVPFRIDITDAVRSGRNRLEIRVTNLWPNRLIGDEHKDPDSEWLDTRLKRWPDWLLAGKPSPSGRLTFSTRRHWKKSDALLPSGLLGPVTLRFIDEVPVSFSP
ncbi:MAG: glycosyl hydrolase [Opitutaceae bacterium]